MKPINPRIQNFYTQTGIENDISVMWEYDAGTHSQTAYQIDVYDGKELIYTTGRQASDEQNGIWISQRLDEQKQYGFTVSVWDEQGVCEKSEMAYFITGVKRWRGNWIGNAGKKPFIARKRFYSDSECRAVLCVCVTGQYEVMVNGARINAYTYSGSQTDFDKHIHYHTYEISVVEGENEITIEAANGWYIGDDGGGKRYFYTMDKGYRPFGECLLVLAQIKKADGYIVTDNIWEVSRSQTVLADIYGSEDIDRTVEYSWEAARVLDACAPKGKIIPCNYPYICRKYAYDAVCVDRERMIFDFSQNMASQFYLKIKGARGQQVKLIPAEKLSKDGDIEQTVDTYSLLTLSGGEDIFERRFSLNGARWYKIEGAEFGQIREFKSFFATSSATDCGRFHCCDERLNSVYRLILKAVESNLNHSHTDCPTIEKLGWLEPNHLMARAVMFNKDVDALWSKIAMDMRDAQYEDDEEDTDSGAFAHEYKSGLIPSIAPRYAKFTVDWKEGSFWDIVPWGSSIILAAYEQYRFYGNKRVLEENYDSAKKYIEYLGAQYDDYSRLYGKEGGERFICAGLGDWGYEQNKGRSRENIETAFYYHDLVVMAEISRILKKGSGDLFLERARAVKERYNKALLTVNRDKAYYCAYDDGGITQANQAIPLCFGMVPQKYVKKVRAALVELCDRKHLQCGEIGLVYILRALSEAGRNDIIYEMILKDTHPSYLRFVEQGETTLPEFWRDDARSRNHDMMGHIMEWFFTQVAGISSSDGFRSVEIKPACMDFIESFECEYNSVRGKITVRCDKGRLDVKVPNNVRLISR